MSQFPTPLLLPLFAAAVLLSTPTLKAAGLDSNGDGLVSSAEADYDPKLRADFEKLDVNGDGRLDNSEISGLGAPPPPAAVLVEENRPNYDGPGSGGGAPVGTPGGGSASGPGVPSAPGLPSGGGSVSAPGGAAPSAGSAGTRGGGSGGR